jgi:hypothetical protein
MKKCLLSASCNFYLTGWTILPQTLHEKRCSSCLSIEWCKRCCIFLSGLSSLGPFRSVTSLTLWAVLIDVYNMEMLYSWHHSIDITLTLLHVKFEVGFSISVWRNGTVPDVKGGLNSTGSSKYKMPGVSRPDFFLFLQESISLAPPFLRSFFPSSSLFFPIDISTAPQTTRSL